MTSPSQKLTLPPPGTTTLSLTPSEKSASSLMSTVLKIAITAVALIAISFAFATTGTFGLCLSLMVQYPGTAGFVLGFASGGVLTYLLCREASQSPNLVAKAPTGAETFEVDFSNESSTDNIHEFGEDDLAVIVSSIQQTAATSPAGSSTKAPSNNDVLRSSTANLPSSGAGTNSNTETTPLSSPKPSQQNLPHRAVTDESKLENIHNYLQNHLKDAHETLKKVEEPLNQIQLALSQLRDLKVPLKGKGASRDLTADFSSTDLAETSLDLASVDEESKGKMAEQDPLAMLQDYQRLADKPLEQAREHLRNAQLTLVLLALKITPDDQVMETPPRKTPIKGTLFSPASGVTSSFLAASPLGGSPFTPQLGYNLSTGELGNYNSFADVAEPDKQLAKIMQLKTKTDRSLEKTLKALNEALESLPKEGQPLLTDNSAIQKIKALIAAFNHTTRSLDEFDTLIFTAIEASILSDDATIN